MPQPLAGLNLGMSQGVAVLGLMERAKIPPVPSFYRLLYDYVSGVQGVFSTRVRDVLEDRETAQERLYSEFIAPYENSGAVDAALSKMVARLATLDRLLVESSDASAAQAASLETAQAGFSMASLNARLAAELIRRVQEANLTLLRANSRLASELDAARDELEQTQSEIALYRENGKRDPLTGLANRMGLDAGLSEMTGSFDGVSCIAIDIDHFKALNDGYGHQVGDEVLRIVARALLAATRSTDVVGRSGGDEFMVLMPRATLESAHKAADQLRMAIAQADLGGALGPGVLGGITASIGVTDFRSGDSISSFIERADRCLYRAKMGGRNRVESFAA